MTKRKVTIDFINKYFAKGLKEGKITEKEKAKWLDYVRKTYSEAEKGEDEKAKLLKATNQIKAHFIELYFPELNTEDIGTGDFI